MSKCNDCAFVPGCDVCEDKPTGTNVNWHNVQEFDVRLPKPRIVSSELDCYNRLCDLLKQRLGCKEVKVWVLMEGKEND